MKCSVGLEEECYLRLLQVCPDRIFHNFRATKLSDQPGCCCCLGSSGNQFRSSKIVIVLVSVASVVQTTQLQKAKPAPQEESIKATSNDPTRFLNSILKFLLAVPISILCWAFYFWRSFVTRVAWKSGRGKWKSVAFTSVRYLKGKAWTILETLARNSTQEHLGLPD